MIDKMFNKYLWHPWLFAIYYVVFPFLINIQHLLIGSIVKPMLIVLGGTVLIFLIFLLIFREVRFASILTSIFLILFFSYPPVFLAIQAIASLIAKQKISFDSTLLVSKYWIILSLIIVFSLLILVRKKSKSLLRFLTIALNAASILLIVLITGYELTKSSNSSAVAAFKDSWSERVQQNAKVVAIFRHTKAGYLFDRAGWLRLQRSVGPDLPVR